MLFLPQRNPVQITRGRDAAPMITPARAALPVIGFAPTEAASVLQLEIHVFRRLVRALMPTAHPEHRTPAGLTRAGLPSIAAMPAPIGDQAGHARAGFRDETGRDNSSKGNGRGTLRTPGPSCGGIAFHGRSTQVTKAEWRRPPPLFLARRPCEMVPLERVGTAHASTKTD